MVSTLSPSNEAYSRLMDSSARILRARSNRIWFFVPFNGVNSSVVDFQLRNRCVFSPICSVLTMPICDSYSRWPVCEMKIKGRGCLYLPRSKSINTYTLDSSIRASNVLWLTARVPLYDQDLHAVREATTTSKTACVPARKPS